MHYVASVRLGSLHRSALFLALRLLVFFILAVLITSEITHVRFPKLPLFFLSVFIMQELFFRFKILRVVPVRTISANDGKNVYASCTQSALHAFLSSYTTQKIMQEVLFFAQARFILEKCGIEKKELVFVDIAKDTFARSAFDTAKIAQGRFVTPMDIVASYLLLTEEQTKLLFSKKIKREELLDILTWSRAEFTHEEFPKKTRVHFGGGGIGEALVTGWTLETKKYTVDLTYQGLASRPFLTGRQTAYKTLVEGLLKPENNNVLLLGEIGVGKETLVEAFLYDSYEGALAGRLQNRRILELMVGPLIAGASDRGELEARLQAIIEEVSHSGNVVLYIPELQNIVGSSSFNIDLSGALLPYLRNGTVPVIASITPSNFKTYLDQNPLKEAFEIIKVEQPEKQLARLMLFEKTAEIEKKTKTIITYRALAAGVDFASRYLQDEALPGSAVRLLEDSANTVSLTSRSFFDKTHEKIVLEDDVISKIEEKTKVSVAAPKGEEKELLLHLEDKLHERLIDQQEAITLVSEAMRRLRSGLASPTRPISFLFLGPTGVGKTETAKALADLYYGGEEHIIRLDMSEYSDEEGLKRLLGAAPGEGVERGELTDKIHDNPSSLVLLDEFEKAHTKIHDLFLQVLEDGRLTDNKGRTVSFVNSIIIATSNAGAEFIREEIKKGTLIDKQFQTRLLDYLQTNHLFRPELLNRFDDVVTFKSLGPDEIIEITKLMLNSLSKQMQEKDIEFTFNEKVLQKITTEGVNEEFGARPLRRYIQDTIEDLLSQKILKDEIKRGDKVLVTVDENNNLQLTVNN